MRRPLATVLAAAALVAACGSDGGSSDTSSAASATSAGPTTTVASAPATDAPDFGAIAESDSASPLPQADFVATDVITGDAVDVGALSQSELVIWFWAPW